jgi:hypothetical protein
MGEVETASIVLVEEAQAFKNNAAARVTAEAAGAGRAKEGSVFIGLMHWIVGGGE